MASQGRKGNGSAGPGVYEIRVKGHLEDRWADRFAPLVITHEAGGISRLHGEVQDQPALHGTLASIRDLGMTILSVERVPGESMNAIIQERYGGPEILAEKRIERPAIKPNEMLVRVRAAGVDRGVWHLMTGQPYLIRTMGFGLRRPKQVVPGMDVAGVVEAIGSGVERFQPGDEVFGTCSGSFAEYAAVRAADAEHKPARLTFEEAAAIPVSGLAAWQAVHREARVQPGQSVLVLGASGGVGSFAVQLAKAAGAEVTGVCSTSKVDFVRELGADHVVDYTREDFAGYQRYDVIIDIAGNRRLSMLRRALSHAGTLVIVGGENGGRVLGGQGRPLAASILFRFSKQKFRWQLPKDQPGDLGRLKAQVEEGKLTPAIDRTFPLAAAADAIRHLLQGRARGKVVITI